MCLNIDFFTVMALGMSRISQPVPSWLGLAEAKCKCSKFYFLFYVARLSIIRKDLRKHGQGYNSTFSKIKTSPTQDRNKSGKNLRQMTDF